MNYIDPAKLVEKRLNGRKPPIGNWRLSPSAIVGCALSAANAETGSLGNGSGAASNC
jgi:hypothetical protein